MLQSFVPVGILRLVQGNQIYYIFYEFIFLLCVLFVLVVVDLKSHVFEIIYAISGISRWFYTLLT